MSELKRLRKIENYIIEFTQDLVSYERYEKYIAHLFTFAPGVWISGAELYKLHQEEAGEHPDPLFASILKHTNLETIHILWMPYPYDIDGMCTIVFLWQETFRSTVALYNKTRLDKKQSAVPPPRNPP